MCENGICLPSCTCRGCDTGEVCGTNGKCVDPGCEKQSCNPPATQCVAGSCKDNCLGVICPGGQECNAGLCNLAMVTVSGTGGFVGTINDSGVDAIILSGSGGRPGQDGGFDVAGGSGGSGATPGKISGCACESTSAGEPGTWASFLMVAALAGLRGRRRRPS